ncbi:MAG TPA: DUF5812 family protein [Halobacteriales archaeon]|nr:DUF5812 family protein [Halobacteriales archaeon]
MGQDDDRSHGETPEERAEAGAAEKSGTFLVTAVDEGSAVLSAVADGQVCPLGANPGFEAGEVVEGRLEPEGPLGVTWRAAEVDERWTPEVEAVDGSPGRRAREAAEDLGAGRLARVSIEEGELHVLAVPPERTEAAAEEVAADETTLRIAARLGARRVEVRAEAGVVGVRYLQ